MRRWWLWGLLLALILALLSPLASSAPDGLERVALDEGFMGRALEPFFKIMPHYVFPGIADESLATVLAGVIGTLILFILGWGFSRLILRRRHVRE